MLVNRFVIFGRILLYLTFFL